MPVDVSRLRAQISDYSERIAQEAHHRTSTVEQLRRSFQSNFDSDALLSSCIAATKISGRRRSGALFNCDEAINRQFAFGDEPERYALIAADGSQIMPDRHKPLLFAYIQAGCACVVYGGTDQSLSLQLQQLKPSRLIFESDLFDENGEIKPPGEIANQRDTLEIELLAQACQVAHEAGFRPVLVADGSLAPFALLNDRNLRRDANRARQLLEPIMAALDKIHVCNALVCGYIDRPNSNGVARACALAGVPLEHIDEARLRAEDRQIGGIFDRHVLEHVLKPGHRTALFDPHWEVNEPNYLGRHAMRACYANFGAGNDKQAIISRIELPRWCADSVNVNTLAAILHRHAGMGEGYPLILKAAHEEAVVSRDDRRDIESAIEQALMARGIAPRASFKQEAKDRG